MLSLAEGYNSKEYTYLQQYSHGLSFDRGSWLRCTQEVEQLFIEGFLQGALPGGLVGDHTYRLQRSRGLFTEDSIGMVFKETC